jgi:Helix-turn-helix domain
MATPETSATAPIAGAAPNPTVPPNRGWHGMTARDSGGYRPEDWRVYSQLGGSPVLVDVVTGSPAWRNEIHSGSWVLLVNEMAFDLFEQSGSAIGTVVNVKAFRPDIGHIAPNLILIEPPPKVVPRRKPKIAPRVPCGEKVAKRDRPKWLMKVTETEGLSGIDVAVAARLAKKYARGSTAFPSIKRLAKDLRVSERTIERATARLHHVGLIEIASGQSRGRVNHYTLTWPAPDNSNVLQLRSRTCEAR